ncbi:HprK-related kinase A [Undibacterium sp. SXout20W]|uniref:HprK-related kinase A n=1 Tax=Undibacterium sp. SXout20W TaxID=3413051 RepID=UPI003BF0CE4C
MKLAELSDSLLYQKLHEGLPLQTGSFVVKIKSSIPSVARGLALLYADYPLCSGEFADFHVTIFRPLNWRRYFKSQVVFSFEGMSPFSPLPYSQAFPMMEWGLNWCITHHAHSYLSIHAAVLEKNGNAVILAAPPGSGKSTLCAALMARGWRLLSDEITLVRLSDGLIEPVPRPVSLKNNSISIIQQFATDAIMSPVVRDTVKGTVAHMKPSSESVHRAQELARAAWIIFPKYVERSETILNCVSPARAMMNVAENSFNYGLLGQRGFSALGRMVQSCQSYEFQYSSLDQAIKTFDQLPSPSLS